jgi:hypothetical protein
MQFWKYDSLIIILFHFDNFTDSFEYYLFNIQNEERLKWTFGQKLKTLINAENTDVELPSNFQ